MTVGRVTSHLPMSETARSVADMIERLLSGPTASILVRSRWFHGGGVVQVVHDLKYRATCGTATGLATSLVDLVPADTAALVPVPRALVRRLRYGVDPAWEVARHLSRLTGIPIVRALEPPLWRPQHAGRSSASPPRFRGRAAPGRSLLVDDVVTTGATLLAAATTCGARRAVTLTSAIGPSV